MSENIQKNSEPLNEEINDANEVNEVNEAVQKETKKEKRGFLKKDPRKEKIEELENKVTELEGQVAELENQVGKGKDDYIRLMAEFDNYRRRTSQEKLEIVSMAATETIKGLLPVLDDCERALKMLDSYNNDAAKEGTELIYNKLLAYLKSKGLSVIEAIGQPFDTDLHEAVAQFPVPEEDKKGLVFDVVQTGYTLNGKVIRFAKVVVGI